MTDLAVPAAVGPDEPTTLTGAEPALVAADEFVATFGEPLARTLDLGTWRPGEDLAALYDLLEQEIGAALAQESSVLGTIRRRVIPLIGRRSGRPAAAGVYRATPGDIEHVHRAVLFNGAVEAADGTVARHDTLALAMTQIGVCLVSYQGDSGSWVHRLFRRDLRATTADPVETVLALIERRQRRSAGDETARGARLSELAERGILAFAERAVLLDRSTAPWRLGHGTPAPYELLTGSGSMELLEAALGVLARLIGEHRKFVYVPSTPRERGLHTIGQALLPLEYAVIDTMEERMRAIVEGGHYHKEYRRLASRFVAEFGPQVLVGVYRVARAGPPQLFYAHRDHVHEAALIAMADSSLHEHRSFPTLIELADTLCATTFGVGDFLASVRVAYAEEGEPFRYQTERETRR